jgi:Domain of unknown function (DUF4279)
MKGHRYTVEFRVFSRSLDPEEITQELGLQPCQIRVEGTPRFDGRRMWAYDGGVGSIDWDSLEKGLAFVLEKLSPHYQTISRYKTSGELIWWCGHFQSTFDGGPTLSAELLRRLGEFGAELYFDNYFSGPDNDVGLVP